MLSLLIECTILMLKVIHDMYWRQRITYDEFINYTEAKIQFLLENMDSISTEIERRNASDIINKCILLKEQNNGQQLLNVFSFNADNIQ